MDIKVTNYEKTEERKLRNGKNTKIAKVGIDKVGCGGEEV